MSGSWNPGKSRKMSPPTVDNGFQLRSGTVIASYATALGLTVVSTWIWAHLTCPPPYLGALALGWIVALANAAVGLGLKGVSRQHIGFVLRRHNACLVRKLCLQIDTELVRRFEGGLRRAPGVETMVVEAVGPANPKDAQPALFVHRWITGQGKDAGIMSAAQKGWPAVDYEPAVLSPE